MTREMLQSYAAEYEAAQRKLSGRQDDQSSIHYPTVFLFIGDAAEDAVAPMMQANSVRWDNHAGVIYYQIASRGEETSVLPPADATAQALPESGGSRETAAGRMRTVLDGLADVAAGDKKKVRQAIWQAFRENSRCLQQLNRALRQISDRIADYGRLYHSFDRLHMAVVTRVDDPMNVLVPEITLLARTIFQQLFKSVQLDLYTLIQEQDQDDGYGYAGAAGIGFLRELTGMQQPDYRLTAELLVTGDGLSIPVSHGPAPLFDLVYVLSDRDERGLSIPGGLEDNAALIGTILLLKNRKRRQDDEGGGGPATDDYNNASFRSSLKADSGRQGYVSAGLAAVRRPNHAIALAVLYHSTRELRRRLEADPGLSDQEILAVFGLDEPAMTARMTGLLPDPARLEDMNGMLTHAVSFEQLRRMTLAEAENALLGEGGERFFRSQFADVMQERLAELRVEVELRQALTRGADRFPGVSFPQLAAWTQEQPEPGEAIRLLQARSRELTTAIQVAEQELEQTLSLRVDELKFQRLPLLGKHNTRAFLRVFFELVYGQKWDLLQLHLERELCRRFAVALARLHPSAQRKAARLAELEESIRQEALASIRRTDDYTGQNILAYYERVTAEIFLELEERRGPGFLQDPRAIGNADELLEDGTRPLAERLIAFCREQILPAEPFALSFEEELLRRANVSVDYSNREALSREDLFLRLYRTLQEQAMIRIRLLDYTHEHRHEESYLFGDGESAFVRYALGADASSRLHKLGVVHERRSSSVDKLSLMGGFHLEDLIYYRNNKVYYETYLRSGYLIHGQDPETLPELL
ncbi:transcription initiation factor TFIID [Paenibacillus sp. 1P07SE]|uniref:transcription initiation factor TFIID n=1 Tax=Paenibacillus sp. 1P07SE TaxID=3132209 RepID=UPI0039A592D9